jgi:hypothetical protein
MEFRFHTKQNSVSGLHYSVNPNTYALSSMAVFLWGGKTHCALIATPNVKNANRRQKKGKS